MTIEVKPGDIVRLRKEHPCGGDEWEVVRVGAYIGLKCLKCNRTVSLTRRTLDRRTKEFVRRAG